MNRRREWHRTARFALLPALVLAVAVVTRSNARSSDAALGAYFAALSLAGVGLTVADVATGGHL